MLKLILGIAGALPACEGSIAAIVADWQSSATVSSKITATLKNLETLVGTIAKAL